MSQKKHNSPGLIGAVPPRIGSLYVEATCDPTPMASGWAFTVACDAVITAAGSSPVAVQVQSFNSATQTEGAPQHRMLNPGETWSFGTPPKDHEWLVVDVSQHEAEAVAIGAMVTGGVILGLAGYGTYRIIEDRIQAHRRKSMRQRLTRWFFGR